MMSWSEKEGEPWTLTVLRAGMRDWKKENPITCLTLTMLQEKTRVDIGSAE